MMQGLLTARQYFKGASAHEQRPLSAHYRALGGSGVGLVSRQQGELFHLLAPGRPQWGFQIHHPLIGFNETMVSICSQSPHPLHKRAGRYVLLRVGQPGQARARIPAGLVREAPTATTTSTAPPILASRSTWAWAAVDRCSSRITPSWDSTRTPCTIGTRRRTSTYNRNIALINRAYCIANPKHYAGYGADAWA